MKVILVVHPNEAPFFQRLHPDYFVLGFGTGPLGFRADVIVISDSCNNCRQGPLGYFEDMKNQYHLKMPPGGVFIDLTKDVIA
jgi:hypothetical protein